jgi:hypothetical protein
MSENVSIDEVCRLLEALDEWEEVALHLGLSDQTIQEIRGLSGGNSLRREVMVLKWVQCEKLEPSWSKLEKALVSTNQESHAAKIRARSRTSVNPGITATATTSLDDLKEASDSDKGKEILEFDIISAGMFLLAISFSPSPSCDLQCSVFIHQFLVHPSVLGYSS